MYKTLALCVICAALALGGCTARQTYRSSCGAELDAAWKELDIAKAKGFSGSVSYSKALGLLSVAKTMQVVENFDACVAKTKKARYYIKQSTLGH